MSPALRHLDRVPVYVFPVRIQQGWGDVREIANACWAIHRSAPQLELSHLPSPDQGSRPDPRAQLVDPRRAGPVRFPPIARRTRPRKGGKAIVLATWLGTTARRRDAEGGPLPGALEPTIEMIREAHGRDRTLMVSLEEFGSDQSSREAIRESWRQAGRSPGAIRRHLASPQGARDLAAYRHAFELARGASETTLLHLVATFRPDPRSFREFPFLLPIGPFRPPTTGPALPPGRSSPHAPRRVVWYASPPSSPEFARRLLPALAALPRPVELTVRADRALLDRLCRTPGRRPTIRWLLESAEGPWARAWSAADLRIASGSQSLVEAVALRRPLLYFNGMVQGPGEPSRAFRREKLLSLIRGMRAAESEPQVVADLQRFADGVGLEGVLRRALLSERWRSAEVRALRRLPGGFPAGREDGGRFLVRLLRAFARSSEAAPDFVRAFRRGDLG